MLRALDLEAAELSVSLTDDRVIGELNGRYRNKPRATDVLAFPMDGTGPGPSGQIQLLGDVVISLETAGRQARERRRTALAEVTHLLAHGILHLVGYDHGTPAEERRMEGEAARLVAQAARRPRPRRTLSRRLRDRR